jgi:hypothetical protein
MSSAQVAPARSTTTPRKGVNVKATAGQPAVVVKPARHAGIQVATGTSVATIQSNLFMLNTVHSGLRRELSAWRVLEDTPANRKKMRESKRVRTEKTRLIKGGAAFDEYNALLKGKRVSDKGKVIEVFPRRYTHDEALAMVTSKFLAILSVANRYEDEIKTLQFQISTGTAAKAK